MNGGSLWPRLAELPLVIEACEYERLQAVLSHEFDRVTTHVRLLGGGIDGLGEDVSVFREDGSTLHEARPSLPLEGVVDLAAETERLTREGKKLDDEVAKIDAKLGKPDFIARAPEEVVEEQRERRAEALARRAKIDEALARLRDVG